MRQPLIGLYPGTFDPITKGHLDIIHRATKVVDRLIIAVASNPGKGPLFTSAERVEMVREDVADLKLADGTEIEVVEFDCLLMHLADQVNARVLIRGLRAVSDFEYEFQMASMNARLNPEVETLFLTASERQQFIASRFVKEIGALGGDITSFVSARVAARVRERFADRRKQAAEG